MLRTRAREVDATEDTELNDLRTALDAANRELDQTRGQNEKLQTELEAMRLNVRRVHEATEDLRAAKTEAEQEVDRRDEVIEQLRNQLRDVSVKEGRARREMDEFAARNEVLERDAEAAREATAGKEEELIGAREKVNDLLTELREQQDEVMALRRELDAVGYVRSVCGGGGC